jgi:hypothetical protein
MNLAGGQPEVIFHHLTTCAGVPRFDPESSYFAALADSGGTHRSSQTMIYFQSRDDGTGKEPEQDEDAGEDAVPGSLCRVIIRGSFR